MVIPRWVNLTLVVIVDDGSPFVVIGKSSRAVDDVDRQLECLVELKNLIFIGVQSDVDVIVVRIERDSS
jgi:hypothetical protein